MIPLESVSNDVNAIPDQQQDVKPQSPSVEPKKSLKDFARLIKDKYPTVYDDLDDDTLAKSVLKKYPEYGDMVDLGEITTPISKLGTTIPMSSFEKQFHESLQPTSGLVQVGIPATQRPAGAMDIEIDPVLDFDPNNTNTGKTQLNLEKLFELGQISLADEKLSDDQLLDLVDKRLSSALGIDPKGRKQLRDMGVDPYLGMDRKAFANQVRGAIGQAKGSGGNLFTIPLTQSYTQVAEAYRQGGVAAAFEQAKLISEEAARAKASIHEITPEETAKVESARRAVSFKLGLANATIAQNEFWTNLLSMGNPMSMGRLAESNLIPGTATAKEAMGKVQPFLPEFYKDQSLLDASIELVPNTVTSTARMLAMASLGAGVAQATKAGPVLGTILGMQADAGLQNLDKPLTEQAAHQLITLAMSGAGVSAGVARNVLASRGIFVPNVLYVPAEGAMMGIGTYGAMEVMSPEATFQQKLSNSLVGGLLPLGFAAAHGLTPKAKPAVVPETPREPLQLTAGVGDMRLSEKFPVYEGKFADSYTINLGKPGDTTPLSMPYAQGEQIPLFDAVIGGQKARTQMGKSLQGMSDEGLREAFTLAGGMEHNLPTERNELISAIMDLNSSKYPLMEATTNNAAVEGWMQISRTDQHLTTPFHFGKEYRLLEDAPKYYKVQDTENTNSIFRIAKFGPGGLTAEIFPVENLLSEKRFRIPDFQGQNAVTQPLLFPEPQAKAPTTNITNREGAAARLKLLTDYTKGGEYAGLSKEGKANVNAEIADLNSQLSTPVERNQLFVSRPEAARHKEGLEHFSKTEHFKELDPQYQELIRKEISDLDFLLNQNKGTPEDVLRQEKIYYPMVGENEKIPLNIPTNFIEKSVVETIAEYQLAKQQAPEAKAPPNFASAPADSPLWRAVDKAPLETLQDVVRRAGGDPLAMSRAEIELRAFDILGGKRVDTSATDPAWITASRERLNTEGKPQVTDTTYDQSLVYAYDYGYKPGMRFLDFYDNLVAKFGEDAGRYTADVWEQVSTSPATPKDLTEQFAGANEKFGDLLAQVPKGVDPTPVGEAEIIGLAKDANDITLATGGKFPKAPLAYERVLNPEDWLRGVDTTPEEIATNAAEMVARKRIVSKEAYDTARQEIRDSLRTMNAGVSPRQLRAMAVVMAYHVENGIYNFGKAFASKATELFGDVAKSNMMELWEDTSRYLRMYRTSPVLNKLSQLPGGMQLGRVLDATHKISFGGVDAFRRAFSLGSRSPQAREIGDLWAFKQAETARAVDTMKAQLGAVHGWAEGFLYKNGGSMLNPKNFKMSELNSKTLREEMLIALDEGKEHQLLDRLKVPADIKVLINEMRTTLADMRQRIREISPNALDTVVENYFPRIWEFPDSPEGLAASRTGAPLTGGKSFLKQRTLDSTREGLALGLKLKSENFVDIFLAKYEEMNKFIKMNEVLQYMRKNEMEKIVDRADVAGMKEFWKPLNDKTSEILRKVETQDGDTRYADSGKVRVYPAMVADLINSHLSPSLHQYPAFRAWNAFSNFANQFQLIGYFHAALISADAAFRLPGLAAKGMGFDAWQHLYHGEPKAALGVLKESSRALATFLTTGGVGGVLYHGNKMYKEWNQPGSQASKYAKRVQFAQLGGAQSHMEAHFQNKAIEGIVKNIQNVAELLAAEDPEVSKVFGTAKQVAAGAAKLPFAAIEVIMRPMLEQLVPRAKLGVQYYMQGYEMSRMGSRANAKDVRRTSAKVEAVISDTLGQMNYGNLHMNKTVKEVLMSVVRATGFQFGAQRTAYMPIHDTVKFAKDLVTPGERAEFTHRMAYMIGIGIGLPIMHGISQAIVTKLNTGKVQLLGEDKDGKFSPELAMKDSVAFRTGRLDQNGDPERWYIPNLGTKELYPVFGKVLEGRPGAAAQHQVEILGHKLNPGVGIIGDLWSNRDFYGRYVFDPNDDKGYAAELGDYALSQLSPFFMKNKEVLESRGVTGFGRFASFFGPTPAPQYINASTAEDVMMEILKEAYPKTGKSSSEYERGLLKRKFMNQWRSAVQLGDEKLQDAIDTEMDAAVEAGKLTVADRKAIFKGVDKSRTENLFSRLAQQNIQDALRIYESWMSPEERGIVLPILQKSRKRITRLALSAEAKEALLDRLDKILDRDTKLENLLQDEEESGEATVVPPTPETN